MYKIICVTPAGRRHYLDLLKHYVLRETAVHEWHLWDNCRTSEDRAYINELARVHPRIKIDQLPGTDGTNRSVNRFYRFCDDPEAFYIKMDDDLVYLPQDFATRLCGQATAERQKYIWWSPLVVNNAICSWLIKYHSQEEIPEDLSCQASSARGWSDWKFAEAIHQRFLRAVERGEQEKFCVPNFEVSLSRFSINCIGFFGRDVVELGQSFCPLEGDDEEWISAVLPSKTGRPGRVVGSLVVSHFSFFTQEPELLQSRVLDHYFKLAGMAPVPYKVKKRPPSERLFLTLRSVKNWVFGLNPA